MTRFGCGFVLKLILDEQGNVCTAHQMHYKKKCLLYDQVKHTMAVQRSLVKVCKGDMFCTDMYRKSV